MSYSLISARKIVAIKPHNCTWCGLQIAKGARYLREKSTYDGHWQNFAWHEACREFSWEHFRHEEEFLPGENEQPFPNLMRVDAILEAMEPLEAFDLSRAALTRSPE